MIYLLGPRKCDNCVVTGKKLLDDHGIETQKVAQDPDNPDHVRMATESKDDGYPEAPVIYQIDADGSLSRIASGTSEYAIRATKSAFNKRKRALVNADA